MGNSESLQMHYVISGLLYTLADLMLAFAPTRECYLRYEEPSFPQVFFSPTRISWGTDNQSVALRIPPCAARPETRRIEHRVPGGSANIEHVLSAVLIGVYYGLTHTELPQFSKTYGLPSNPLLKLSKLPDSFENSYSNFMLRGRYIWNE